MGAVDAPVEKKKKKFCKRYAVLWGEKYQSSRTTMKLFFFSNLFSFILDFVKIFTVVSNSLKYVESIGIVKSESINKQTNTHTPVVCI